MYLMNILVPGMLYHGPVVLQVLSWADVRRPPAPRESGCHTVAKQTESYLKIQVENQCYCMAIMQMVVVACLGMKKTPGSCAERSRKDSPETLLSRRGCLRARAKWTFSECCHMAKMIPTGRARRNEEAGFGITSFGVRIKKL